jgi:hypothetical protein
MTYQQSSHRLTSFLGCFRTGASHIKAGMHASEQQYRRSSENILPAMNFDSRSESLDSAVLRLATLPPR